MSTNYHLEELKIARDPSHPRHILPPPLPPFKKVLDVGCGAGQTLMTAYPDRITYGLDVDFEALKLGRSLTDLVLFVCARVEALPYPDADFEAVIARGRLPHTDIHASLKEIRRVLGEDGTVDNPVPVLGTLEAGPAGQLERPDLLPLHRAEQPAVSFLPKTVGFL